MSTCPPVAKRLVMAMVADAIRKPASINFDKNGKREEIEREGCAPTRKLILDRVDGPVTQQIEANVTSVERKIVIVGTTSIDPPPLPASILQLEEARSNAEDASQIRKALPAGVQDEEGEEDE